jgi:hypothetical protein
MPANRIHAQPPAAQDGETQWLTANVVMPATVDPAEQGASFTGLLMALTSLAFERFGAAQENRSPEAVREPVPSCLAGAPVDPFDGQLLRFRKSDSGYQFHSIGPDHKHDSGGRGDLALTVVMPPHFSSPERVQGQAASSPCLLPSHEDNAAPNHARLSWTTRS